MNKLFVLSLAAALAGCTATPQAGPVGSDRDAHGCIGSAGYSWSALRQQCIQPFDNPDIRLPDPDNDTLAVYVIVSANKSRAELFASGVPANTVLESVKGGYASRDGTIRLLRTDNGWRLLRQP